MIDLSGLKAQFNNIDFREKRTGLYKVILPFFYEDGDMYDIFIEESPINNSLIRLSDYGLTLMKLSYNFDIDTENKQEVLNSIIIKNRCNIDAGDIFLDIRPDQFNAAMYQFIQTISKVSNLEDFENIGQDYIDRELAG